VCTRTQIKIIPYLISVLALCLQCNPYSLPENKFSQGETAFTVYQKALDEYKTGEVDEALVLIKQALTMNSGVAYFHELEGDIYRKKGDYRNALTSYERATTLRSNYPEVYRSQAEIYIALGAHGEAIKSYKKIIANDPTRIKVYLNIAEQYAAIREYAVALNSLADYRREKMAFGEEPESSYYKIRGQIYLSQKLYREAIPDLKRFNDLEPDHLEGLALLGACYYAVDEYENGLVYFNRLIRLDENNGKWYMYRGIYFFKKNDLNDAEGQFRFALELDPSLYATHYYLGKIYKLRGEVESALEELRLYRQYMPATVGEDDREPIPEILFD